MTYQEPHILVIDDDLETLELLKIALRKAGFTVQIASCWPEVSDRVQRVYQQGHTFDVIILDLMMPDRSGFDILRSLHVDMVPLPPVIMLSAVLGMTQRLEAQELGVARYLTKPTTPAQLVEAIRQVMEAAKEKKSKWQHDTKLPPEPFLN